MLIDVNKEKNCYEIYLYIYIKYIDLVLNYKNFYKTIYIYMKNNLTKRRDSMASHRE